MRIDHTNKLPTLHHTIALRLRALTLSAALVMNGSFATVELSGDVLTDERCVHAHPHTQKVGPHALIFNKRLLSALMLPVGERCFSFEWCSSLRLNGGRQIRV
jgi:hypothetical protein